MNTVEVILTHLRGLRIGKPRSHRNLVMFPLLTDSSGERGYLTLDEAMHTGTFHVREVSEFGSVPELTAENKGEKPVLLMDGEHLVGAKQNRVLNVSMLVPPGKKCKIPVSCVEQGRWSPGGGEFAAGGEALFARSRRRKARWVTQGILEAGRPMADQAEVWSDVRQKLESLAARSATGAMSDAYGHVGGNLEEFVRAFSPEQDQVGAVFAIGGSIAGMDLFDHEETLRLLLPKLIRSYALDALEVPHSGGNPPEDEAIRNFLEDACNADWSVCPADGLGEWARIAQRSLAGGALVHEGRCIHVFVSVVESGESDRGVDIIRSSRRSWVLPD